MPKGNLLKVIQEEKGITTLDMIQMARQAAAGMAYLGIQIFVNFSDLEESKHIIHRDLALRNLLVNSTANTKYEVKVADFGLSRTITDSSYYTATATNLPIKWTARKL